MAQCRFPDRKPFLFGTVQAESELQALRLAEQAWSEVIPYPPPPMDMLPGLLAFHPGADA